MTCTIICPRCDSENCEVEWKDQTFMAFKRKRKHEDLEYREEIINLAVYVCLDCEEEWRPNHL